MRLGSTELIQGAKGGVWGAVGAVKGTFARVFDSKFKEDLAAAEVARQAKAEKAAGDLVANALILPMLKQVRRSGMGKNSVFSGGIGEKTFGPEFDREIADRLAQSPKMGVKTALAKRLMNGNAVDVHG